MCCNPVGQVMFISVSLLSIISNPTKWSPCFLRNGASFFKVKEDPVIEEQVVAKEEPAVIKEEAAETKEEIKVAEEKEDKFKEEREAILEKYRKKYRKVENNEKGLVPGLDSKW